MKGGNINEFIDHTTYEECAIKYKEEKYFFYGIVFNEKTGLYSYDIAQWDENGKQTKWLFCEMAKTANEILEKFYQAAIWNGKTFWEVESDMEWIDW